MRLLVPVDVRGCAHAVIERALWLTRKVPGGSIDIMTVTPHPVAGGVSELVVDGQVCPLGAALDEETIALLRGYAILLAKNNVLGDIIVSVGPPAECIVAEAHHRQPDLIVMGSHARHGIARAVFGSVAETVLRQAGMAVLIEPAGKGLAERPSQASLQAEAEANG
jgi:nucleotide-binding universal stress UspA family protein